MKRMLLVAAVLVITSCGKKKEEAKTTDPVKTDDKAEPKKAEPKAEPKEDKGEEKKLPDAEMVDHDLAPFGKQFTGFVVTAPKDAKIEFDDPSRHIVLSDTDFIDVSEAPFWEDGVKGLEKDKDNQNIKKVSDTEYRYERTPPLGKSWLVDMKIMLGKEKWSCGTGMTGTFHSAAMADRISTICKSIRKK